MSRTDTWKYTLQKVKSFGNKTNKINSIDFSRDGRLLISSRDDDAIFLYDCVNISQEDALRSSDFGVDLIRFTHSNSTILHSCSRIDNSIRFLCLESEKYITRFPGHTGKITSLCVCPQNDTFLTASLDKTISLWDLRSPQCKGVVPLTHNSFAAYDPEGTVFAAGVGSHTLKLYDVRSYSKGSFANFNLCSIRQNDWTGLKYGPRGKSIMITTKGPEIHLVDAFLGNVLQTFSDFENTNSVAPLEASFTYNSKYILSGSTDGKVHIWETSTGRKISVLEGFPDEPVECLQLNPELKMMVTTCYNVTFWLHKGGNVSYSFCFQHEVETE